MVYTRQELTPLTPVVDAQFPGSLTEAYGLVKDELANTGRAIVAWKLGGTTPTTQKIFNVDKLYFGPIFDFEVQQKPLVAPNFKLFEYKIEAEIALRVSERALDILGEADLITKANIADLFDAWCVAGEMPSSSIANMAAAGVNALVSDRCATGFLVLGDAWPLDSDTIPDWADMTLETLIDGTSQAKGDVKDLVWTPQVCARDFLALAVQHGFDVTPGQWISTGGVTPCIPSPVGSKVTLTLDGQPVVEFKVKD